MSSAPEPVDRAAPAPAEPPATSLLEWAFRHEGALTLVGLALLWALTALYVADGAGLGMGAWEMTRAALWPQDHATSTMGAMVAWDARGSALMAAMWWTMMIAMMAPSAAPTVLLYARVHRHAQAQADAAAQRAPVRYAATAPTGAFVAGYLLAWGAFALAATASHWALERSGLLAAGTMGVRVHALAAAVLVATGLYQLSPWKNACLAHCRAPAAFLARHWRPGTAGALRLGAWHGAYCLGCCWALMALLFVGGVMNLAWIAALSALVLAEKWLPHGRGVGIAAGLAMIAWGVFLLATG